MLSVLELKDIRRAIYEDCLLIILWIELIWGGDRVLRCESGLVKVEDISKEFMGVKILLLNFLHKQRLFVFALRTAPISKATLHIVTVIKLVFSLTDIETSLNYLRVHPRLRRGGKKTTVYPPHPTPWGGMGWVRLKIWWGGVGYNTYNPRLEPVGYYIKLGIFVHKYK